MGSTLTNNERRSRYELAIDGYVVSSAAYVLGDDDITFTHTLTEPAHRNNGYAAVVVGYALDDARARGLRVVAQCWFVREFIDEHPEYADLLAVRERRAGDDSSGTTRVAADDRAE